MLVIRINDGKEEVTEMVLECLVGGGIPEEKDKDAKGTQAVKVIAGAFSPFEAAVCAMTVKESVTTMLHAVIEHSVSATEVTSEEENA